MSNHVFNFDFGFSRLQAQTLNFSLWNDAVSIIFLKSDCKPIIQQHLTKTKYKGVALDIVRKEDFDFLKSVTSPVSIVCYSLFDVYLTVNELILKISHQ